MMGVGGGGWIHWIQGRFDIRVTQRNFFFSKHIINTWQTVYEILVLVCCEDSSKFEHIASQDIWDPAPKMHTGRKEENN